MSRECHSLIIHDASVYSAVYEEVSKYRIYPLTEALPTPIISYISKAFTSD